jgi:uncharacterized membrane protein YeaQ/YmgE (transglycosylase-associated protein family)
VGFVAKLIYPGDDPKGLPATVVVGIAGSYVGGLINYLLGRAEAVSYSGALMGLIGALVCCWVYDKFRLHRVMEMQKFEIRQMEGEVRAMRMRMGDFDLEAHTEHGPADN